MSATEPARRMDIDATITSLSSARWAAAKRRAAENPALVEALQAKYDAAEAAELAALRRGNLWRAYTSSRPFEYEDSSYARLAPGQDPSGRVSGWWASDARNLLLCGKPGRGKTDAAYAVCNEVAGAVLEGVGKPVTVQAVSIAELRDLLTLIPGAHEARDETASARRARRIRDITEADLLLIDDVTAAKITDAFRQALHTLIDTRVTSRGARTVLTMNADDPKAVTGVLMDTLGAAIVSRLRQRCAVAWIDGPDRRAWWDPFA